MTKSYQSNAVGVHVLHHVVQDGPITAKEISTEIEASQQSVQRALRKLHATEYVQREKVTNAKTGRNPYEYWHVTDRNETENTFAHTSD